MNVSTPQVSAIAGENPPLPTTSQRLLEILEDLDIAYDLYHHQPVFTVAEAEGIKDHIPGLDCRNLFLRDKKEQMFLVCAANETMLDMKKLPAVLGCERLSFGSAERLWRILGVRPGSVCPFAIINDKDKAVTIVLDDTMMRADGVNFHPLENDKSVVVAPADLVKFIRWTGHEPVILDLGPAAPDKV